MTRRADATSLRRVASPQHLTNRGKPNAKRRWHGACDDEIGVGSLQRQCLPELPASRQAHLLPPDPSSLISSSPISPSMMKPPRRRAASLTLRARSELPNVALRGRRGSAPIGDRALNPSACRAVSVRASAAWGRPAHWPPLIFPPNANGLDKVAPTALSTNAPDCRTSTPWPPAASAESLG